MSDDRMTPARLDEITALADAATPGPWQAYFDGDRIIRWLEDNDFEYIVDEPVENRENARFIAAARTAVPELIAEVRRAREAEAEAHELLDEKVGQALLDKTMFKGMNVVDGQLHLDLEPAREFVMLWCASMRGMLDGYGAENYVELDVRANPETTVAVDLQDGQHAEDSYTVTIQRRYRPTPHEFRLRAEKERDDALAEVERLRAQLAAKAPPPAHPREDLPAWHPSAARDGEA